MSRREIVLLVILVVIVLELAWIAGLLNTANNRLDGICDLVGPQVSGPHLARCR
jgi:hypothetical protein